jgi:hypothetical protein
MFAQKECRHFNGLGAACPYARFEFLHARSQKRQK